MRIGAGALRWRVLTLFVIVVSCWTSLALAEARPFVQLDTSHAGANAARLEQRMRELLAALDVNVIGGPSSGCAVAGGVRDEAGALACIDVSADAASSTLHLQIQEPADEPPIERDLHAAGETIDEAVIESLGQIVAASVSELLQRRTSAAAADADDNVGEQVIPADASSPPLAAPATELRAPPPTKPKRVEPAALPFTRTEPPDLTRRPSSRMASAYDEERTEILRPDSSTRSTTKLRAELGAGYGLAAYGGGLWVNGPYARGALYTQRRRALSYAGAVELWLGLPAEVASGSTVMQLWSYALRVSGEVRYAPSARSVLASSLGLALFVNDAKAVSSDRSLRATARAIRASVAPRLGARFGYFVLPRCELALAVALELDPRAVQFGIQRGNELSPLVTSSHLRPDVSVVVTSEL